MRADVGSDKFGSREILTGMVWTKTIGETLLDRGESRGGRLLPTGVTRRVPEQSELEGLDASTILFPQRPRGRGAT
jgi:hypothetical protein